MKTFARAAFAALIIAAGTTLIPFVDASARCRKEGEARVPGVGADAMHAATEDAIADWKRKVLERCGVHASWAAAQGHEIECKEKSDGTTTKCEVEATPAL